MTNYVTPPLLACISLAYAIGVKNKKVLEEMMEEATAEGDYAAAGQVLELAMTDKLTEEQLESEEIVREKVKDLVKLGELKWRYRVVEEGQNPRDEAIKVLDEAQARSPAPRPSHHGPPARRLRARCAAARTR